MSAARSPRRRRPPRGAARRPPATVTTTLVAWACLPTLVSASRRTASTSSASCPVTTLSTGPLNDTWGWMPSTGRSSCTRSSTLGCRPSLLMVSSMSKMALRKLADRLVELVDRLPDAHDRLGPLDQAGRALQRQPDGEEALDHRVVQVPGDPVAVLGQRAVAHQRVQAGVLDGDAGRHGEGEHELLVVLGELARASACWSDRGSRRPRRGRGPGTPRNDVIAGWCAGVPKLSGLSAMLARRSGLSSAISVPRTPRPVGRGPMACSSSLLRPTVMNWSSARPSSVSTPSAPYCASTRSQASSMIRRSTTGRCSSASRIRIACTRRRSLAGSSIRSNGCTVVPGYAGGTGCSARGAAARRAVRHWYRTRAVRAVA